MHFEPFSISSATYTQLVFRGYFARYWWLYVLPLIILTVLTFYNINFLYTILMLCFILFPMALIMVYFWYLLTEEIRWSILEKEMTVNDSGIMLTFEGFTKELRWEEFSGYSTTGKYLLLKFKVRPFTYFVIPFTIFVDKEQLRSFVKTLGRHNISIN
ncbi:MAG: hypothetical protein ACI4BH_06520 [Muribaculaceae bacterium]